MCCLDPLGLFHLGWLRSNGLLAKLYRQPCQQWYHCWSSLPDIYVVVVAIAGGSGTVNTACAIASYHHYASQSTVCRRAVRTRRGFSHRCSQVFAGTTAICPTVGATVTHGSRGQNHFPSARPDDPPSRRLPGVLPAPRQFPSIDRIWPAKFPLACAVVAAGSGSRAYVPRLVR